MSTQPPDVPGPGPQERAPAQAPVLDGVIALTLAVFGLAVAAHGLTLGLSLDERTMPGVAPLAFGLALAVPAISLAVKSARDWRGDRPNLLPARTERRTIGRRLALPLVALLALVLYTIAMPRLGYLITTFLFAVIVLWMLRWRGFKGLVAAAGVTGVVYALFLLGLSVPLPRGLLS